MLCQIMTNRTNWRPYMAAGILFLLLSCVVIGKALYLDNCFAYDTNDDMNHNFTGLYMAKQLLKDGAMPFFNYYNNFGTPLMGDALTYPFALQAIPYYLADISYYPLVATINKFVLCFLTLAALLIYYRMYNFSIFTSTATAICVFFNFPHFWFFAHHHYQATLIFTVSIFIAQKTALQRDTNRLLFGAVALLFGLMIYSVSANLIVLCAPFFVLHPFFLRANRKAIVTNLLALFTGGVIGGVQIITIAVAAMNSARIGTSFSDDFLVQYFGSSLMLKLLYYVNFFSSQFCHINVIIYFPMILILMYGAGIYLLFRNKKSVELYTSITLGLLPTLPIYFMLVHTGLWKALPILKSTDITRVLWITMIFIGIGIGYFIEGVYKRTVNNRLILGMIVAQAAAAMFAVYLFFDGQTDIIVLSGYCSALLLLFIVAFRNRVAAIRGTVVSVISIVVSGAILATLLFTYSPIVFFLGGWAEPRQCTSWNYFSDMFRIEVFRQTAERITASGRFALNERSLRGYELQLEVFGRHGGGGRSIMMDGKLHEQLISRKIIENDDPHNVYHFVNPWETSTANRLGLRYFGTREFVQHENWQITDQWGDFYIYENQQKPALVSLRDEWNNIIFVETFKIVGNDLIINLPKIELGSKLLVAMTARPGYTVKVDGADRSFSADDFGFFNLDVNSADRVIVLSYNPLSLRWLM